MSLWLIAAVFFALMFGLAGVMGAPYLPIRRQDYDPLIELSGLRPGDTLLDLGSGDGRILRAAARRGIRATGYEINPLLYVISVAVCWRYRHLVSIKLADYWSRPLPAADVIYVFLIDRLMPKLDRKLSSELTRPTRVVSFVFAIPGRTPSKRNRNTFVYDYTAGRLAQMPATV